MYPERTRELNEQLTRAAASLPEDARRMLVSAIKTACDTASAALTDLVLLAERASIGNLDSARKWRERCDIARSTINTCFGDAAGKVVLEGELGNFWWEALRQENNFFETLARAVTAQLHDDLLVHQDVLNKLLGQLWDKWTYLLTNDKSFEDDQKRAMQEVAAIAKKVVDDMDNEARRIAEANAKMMAAALAAAEKLNNQLGNLPAEALKKLIEALLDRELPDHYRVDEWISRLKVFFENLRLRLQVVRDQIALYQRLLQAEQGSVLLIFKQTKDEVEQYRSKNGIPQAREMLEKAKRALSDWESALRTPGQERDAETFVTKVIALLDADWRVTEELDGKFTAKFRGIFIAPLGSETIEQLAEAYLMGQQLEEVNRNRVPDKTRAVAGLLEAAPQSATDPLRALEETISRVPDEVRELAKMKSSGFKEYVQKKLAEHIRDAMPIMKEIERDFDPSNLDREFSREMLLKMLQ